MYSPEFLNRIDAVITYQPLDSEALTLILDQQIADLQRHVNSRLGDKCFSIEIAEDSRMFLLEKGTSPEYGARELKRSIHRYLTQPLATLVIEKKIQPGSTVRVSVREGKDSLKFESHAADQPVVVPVPPKVLVVDDNRDFLRLLSLEFSETTSWQVVTAQSVEEAMSISSAQTIDFALLDLLLPDGNGIDLGAQLKQRRPEVQVAIMTGAELSTAEENECRNYEFYVVNKPFLPQQIISVVRERVGKTSHVRASA
jgi:ActR/RegA family two-component response regulator